MGFRNFMDAVLDEQASQAKSERLFAYLRQASLGKQPWLKPSGLQEFV
jgi:hypothetical protein